MKNVVQNIKTLITGEHWNLNLIRISLNLLVNGQIVRTREKTHGEVRKIKFRWNRGMDR